MGIDFHGLNFLAYAAKRQPLGATVTIGRQNVHLPLYMLRQILKDAHVKPYGPFCETLLQDRMGATSVHSFDASDFEQATFVHDFNKPLEHGSRYDTVVDCGTLEHVFNVPVALENVASLCKQGGRILHVLPANNFPGHGFWQFSPELFFSLYSEANGFADTEVFIAETDNERSWFRAKVPSGGVRVEYLSGSRSYVLVSTRKMAAATGHSVQQSDYVHEWQAAAAAPDMAAAAPAPSRLRSVILRSPVVFDIAAKVLKAYRSRKAAFTNARVFRLSPRNRHFTEVTLASLR